MPKQSKEFLGDLLPLKFEGGFKVDAIEDECDECGQLIGVERWYAELAYLHKMTCVIDLSSTCFKCNSPQRRSIRIRAQEEGWAAIDRQIDGEWKTSVIGNVAWPELLRRKIMALPLMSKLA